MHATTTLHILQLSCEQEKTSYQTLTVSNTFLPTLV